MIMYTRGFLGIGTVCNLRGSVLPKACFWAVSNAILAYLFHTIVYASPTLADMLTSDKGMTTGVSGYTLVFSFLVVFRTREAYSRWWEGLTLLQTTSGEWFGAYSNIIAFCAKDAAKEADVISFQHHLVRLVSLLYGCAIDQISTVIGSDFDIIDLQGLDSNSLVFLSRQYDKCTIVLQWIQQLVLQKHKEGLLDIAPPILSRVFQELSRGKVNITNARKLSEYPFPFPYNQLLAQGLLLQWLLTPILTSILCQDPWWASVLAFITNFFLWSTNYVGEELEDPFGDDPNDLPMSGIMANFNDSLATLLNPIAQNPPSFEFDEPFHSRLSCMKTSLSDTLDADQTVNRTRRRTVTEGTEASRSSFVAELRPTAARSQSHHFILRGSGSFLSDMTETTSSRTPMSMKSSDTPVFKRDSSKKGKKQRGFARPRSESSGSGTSSMPLSMLYSSERSGGHMVPGTSDAPLQQRASSDLPLRQQPSKETAEKLPIEDSVELSCSFQDLRSPKCEMITV